MATVFCASPLQVSSKCGLKPLKAKASTPKPVRAVRAVSCSAETPNKNVATTVAAAALAAVVSFGAVGEAQADIAGLTPCAESKAFKKRENKEVKGLQKRMAKYEEGSAPALALQATIERTQKRFEFYGKSGLLCGTDGLPHLIADPGLAFRYGHAGDIMIPTVLFIYMAGYTGYAGREYLLATRGVKKPTEKEIIIDVPLALKCVAGSAGWPLRAYNDLRSGTLLEKEENITVSPR
ncbi:hypothetical protein BSKO_06072 [Bryopsis sp. KO-2023]|nr:hypothetical protein BSKO_06072 [Bryopsis sp. KO-2023]